MDIKPIPGKDKALVRFDDLEERYVFGLKAPILSKERRMAKRVATQNAPLFPKTYTEEDFPMRVEIPNRVLGHALGRLAVSIDYGSLSNPSEHEHFNRLVRRRIIIAQRLAEYFYDLTESFE
jgi:hypothetical protein